MPTDHFVALTRTSVAALAATDELAGLRHRLIAVRVHDHFRFAPSSFWYGKPSMDPELEGWWQVFSLAVYCGYVTAVERSSLGSHGASAGMI